MVIMVIVVIKKNYFGGSWSLSYWVHLTSLDHLGRLVMVVMVVIYIFKKKLKMRGKVVSHWAHLTL